MPLPRSFGDTVARRRLESLLAESNALISDRQKPIAKRISEARARRGKRKVQMHMSVDESRNDEATGKRTSLVRRLHGLADGADLSLRHDQSARKRQRAGPIPDSPRSKLPTLQACARVTTLSNDMCFYLATCASI